uniref:Carbamoyl phosphate synthase small chain n=1 Tax=Melanothamnus harveyi TaxID=397005 RepID=A0A1Z1MH31_MELHR|nr:carbamoyl phosphate synthase small subunit [Melanothamnus harveyi]ARW65313.1 carbamoyl phosphate synthase small subunit [Melanothamnus harveyi]
MLNMLYPSVLSLQDGTSYKGWSLFELSSYAGEIVFNTGMTGYQEILSDPSYTGQMVVFTYPEIGNTGLNIEDNESNFIFVKALVAKNISTVSSNWRSTLSLKDYILQKKIPHIFGVDTRALTRKLRMSGVMPGFLSNTSDTSLNVYFNKFNSKDLIRKVTVRSPYYIHNSYDDYDVSRNFLYINPSNFFNYSNNYNVVVVDFGLKFNILRCLLSLGCKVNIVPATVDYNSIVSLNPDGILLSNGPGDPQKADYAINTVRKLIHFSNIPIFGICMGHQILNLACGFSTFKLKFGHRGLNHPSGYSCYSEITSQNHGFAVSSDIINKYSLHESFLVKHLNFNDETIASTFDQKAAIFSVQYHPEASPGPHDAYYLFKVFVDLIALNSKKS